MKHLTTLLLAVGLGTLGALAQNVTVVLKDGTQHKFNADYLSEIRFRDVMPEPDHVKFSTIGLEAYSDGNVTVTLDDAAGTNKCVVDLYGPKTATFLNKGTYTVDNVNNPFTVDPAYSKVTVGTQARDIASGTVKVDYNDAFVYTINVDLMLNDSTRYMGDFTGELPTYSPVINATMSASKYNENPQIPGNFYVKFNDADWKYDIAVIFTADPSATTLPAGTYNASAAGTPGTFSTERSYFDMYSPNASLKFMEGSKIVVVRNGDDYDMTFTAILSDGRTANLTYKGKITGTPTFEQPAPESVVFDTINVENYGSGNTTITLNSTTDKQIGMALDCYGTPTAAFFEPGEYVIGATSGLRIDTDVTYTHYTYDGENTAITSGKMTVTCDNDIYTMEIDVVLAGGTPFKATYSGKLNAFSRYVEKKASAAQYSSLAAGQKPGEFYVKFNDSNYTFESAFDIFAAASATQLPAGKYVYATTGAPGTFGEKSYVELFRPNSNNKMLEGSTIDVAINSGIYTITMDLKFNDGRICNLTFTGQISGTPTFENN